MHTCDICSFKTTRRYDLNKHLKSKKHLRMIENNDEKTDNDDDKTVNENDVYSESEDSVSVYSEAVPVEDFKDELLEFEKEVSQMFFRVL